MTLDRVRLATLADYLAAAAVVSLPWSTSATSILVPLWAVVAILALDKASLRQGSRPLAASLAVALGVLAIAGMLWSEVDWPERLSGVTPFLKLLVVPLLFAQFSRSERAETVLVAFLASASVLLAVSCLLVVFPQIPWPAATPGVPVKDYIIQSAEFVLCCFVLLDRAITAWARSRTTSILFAGAALLFLGDVVFVALSRTSVIVIVVLFVLLGLRHFERRAFAVFVAAGVALAAVTWTASPYLRNRVTHVATELDGAHTSLKETSAGTRLVFWKMSVTTIRDAPLFGHGTGSITEMFARVAAADPTAPTDATNPHNQFLATAIQIGLPGALLLLAMWAAQFRMFLFPGPMAWVGLSAVTQNIVSSTINSHLSDFANGWLYVFGLGIAGGAMLRVQAAARKPAGETTASTGGAAATATPPPALEPAVGPAQ
jgi:O-antigen ligase